jgi:uncharacterized GH25 family protein
MKPLRLARRRALTIFCFFILAAVSAAHGHEFILKPAKFQNQPGAKISFSVLAAHVFMVSDEMEPLPTVKAWLHEDAKRTTISLRENRGAKVLEGEALLSAPGTAVLVGHLEEPVETRTAQGSKAGAKIKREKWSKVFLSGGGAPDKHYEKVLGHKLEIVPLANPLALKVGNELSARILLDGKPLTAMVYATYDGFSRHDYTYAYATESKGGTAHIKFSHPGVWMVRVENRRQVDHKDFNQQVLKATLIFPVE